MVRGPTRLDAATCVGLVCAGLATAVALAAGPGSAAGATTTSELVGGLNLALLAVALPVTLLVEGILIYTVMRFRGGGDPVKTPKNRELELAWTVGTALVLVLVIVGSYAVMADPTVSYTDDEPIAPDEDDVHVEFEAYQWGWDVHYPEEGVSVDADEATLPVDRDIYITVTTRDVIHGFHVPEMALKVDAIPGRENTIRTHTTETGTYQGYCTEYCGTGHSRMYFEVETVEEDEYVDWLERN